MTLYCFHSRQACCEALAAKIRDVSRGVLSRRPFFTLVLSGGTTPQHLYRLLASPEWRDEIAWHKAHIFFGDERCVPPDSIESNFKMAWDLMLKELPIPEHQIHRIHGENRAQVEAIRYQAVIETYWRKTSQEESLFDLTLLGLGGDGHTASLFPGDPALQHHALAAPVAPPNKMKPTVERISLTLRCLAMSANICFLVLGKDKEEVVEAVFDTRSGEYPAAMVKGNTIDWFLAEMDCWGLQK